MPIGWAEPGSCAGGLEEGLPESKMTYFPCTWPTAAAAGNDAAQTAPPQVQGLETLNGGKFDPMKTVALGNNPLLDESCVPRSITTSQFSEPLAPVGSLSSPEPDIVRNSPPYMLFAEGSTG